VFLHLSLFLHLLFDSPSLACLLQGFSLSLQVCCPSEVRGLPLWVRKTESLHLLFPMSKGNTRASLGKKTPTDIGKLEPAALSARHPHFCDVAFPIPKKACVPPFLDTSTSPLFAAPKGLPFPYSRTIIYWAKYRQWAPPEFVPGFFRFCRRCSLFFFSLIPLKVTASLFSLPRSAVGPKLCPFPFFLPCCLVEVGPCVRCLIGILSKPPLVGPILLTIVLFHLRVQH